MKRKVDVNKILEAVIGEDQQGRCKTTVGFFVEEPADEGENRLLDEFYVEKPIIQISDFSDADDNLYYSIEFLYKSRRDEDLKQQWFFLERYVERCKTFTGDAEKMPILVISLVPQSLKGKYSILCNPALPDSITRIEYAGDNTCVVRVLFFSEDVMFISHDESIVDIQEIAAEVEREIDESFASEEKDN